MDVSVGSEDAGHGKSLSPRQEKIIAAIKQLREILSEKPQGFTGLRRVCLDLRRVILGIENCGTTKARYHHSYYCRNEIYFIFCNKV